ncbi:MAG: thioredoxin fold domain-containing protein [Pseudomonadales bacterium]|jgi:thiol:disulfide interchange protein DsbC
MRIIALVMTLISGVAMAETPEDRVRAGLATLNDRVAIMEVREIGSGLFQVVLASGERLYTVEDGRFLLTGDLYEVSENEIVNLTEMQRNGERLAAIEALNPDDIISFAPTGETKKVVYAFTDIDCGYCRKLHDEVQDYTDLGIEIRYLAFPRAGVGSASFQKYVSAFCAADNKQSLTDAKAGREIPTLNCENPVAAQYELGRMLGVSGTPSLVLDSGQMVPGYVPAADLARQLGL